jgi:hypothetical protein
MRICYRAWAATISHSICLMEKFGLDIAKIYTCANARRATCSGWHVNAMLSQREINP